LPGSSTGFSPLFNRNTKRIAIDLRNSDRAEVARQSAASAAVVADKFKSASIRKYGLHYAALSQVNERLVCVVHKGFCSAHLRVAARSMKWCR